MATDGPVTPEQATPATTGERRGFFGRLRRGETKPAATPQTPPKESTAGRMNDVIKGLEQKNTELRGSLATEFGKGKSRFLALRLATRFSIPDPKDNSVLQDNSRLFLDYLIVTPEGFKILRIDDGKNFGHKYDTKAAGFNQAIEMLVTKGNPVYYRNHEEMKANEAKYSTEGSGYTHADGVHRLNFGGGAPSLEFNQYAKDPSVAVLEASSPGAISYLQEAAKRGSYLPQAVEAIGKLQQGDVRLILDPDPAQVAKIIKTNIEDTKQWIDQHRVEKLTTEAKKIAEAQKPQPVEKPKLETPSVNQASSADAALDLLGKL